MSTPRWRWRNAAAASPLPRRCSRRMLNYRHSRPAPSSEIDEPGRIWEGIELLHVEERTNYPLTLSIDDLGEGFLLTAQTQRPLAPERICAYMRVALEGLVEALEQAPQTPMRTIDILPQDERHRLLVEWNDTAVDYPKDRLLHELFEDQAARAPEAVALVFEGAQLSYGELNARANRLAHRLRAQGVGPETIVGLCVERSFEMIIGLLGVLKAGGAYLPVDPDYPRERILFMLDDAAPSLVLTQEHLRERLPETVETLRLDADWETIALESAENPAPTATPQNLAYVIYTSGSTGQAERRRRRPWRAGEPLWIGCRLPSSLAASTGYCRKPPTASTSPSGRSSGRFAKAHVWFSSKRRGIASLRYLSEVIKRERVTTLHFVPSMLEAFLSASALPGSEHLRRVLCSGEELSAHLAERFHTSITAELQNLYGPTEVSIDVTAYPCRREVGAELVPIGRPIWNTQIYLSRPLRLSLPWWGLRASSTSAGPAWRGAIWGGPS